MIIVKKKEVTQNNIFYPPFSDCFQQSTVIYYFPKGYIYIMDKLSICYYYNRLSIIYEKSRIVFNETMLKTLPIFFWGGGWDPI